MSDSYALVNWVQNNSVSVVQCSKIPEKMLKVGTVGKLQWPLTASKKKAKAYDAKVLMKGTKQKCLTEQMRWIQKAGDTESDDDTVMLSDDTDSSADSISESEEPGRVVKKLKLTREKKLGESLLATMTMASPQPQHGSKVVMDKKENDNGVGIKIQQGAVDQADDGDPSPQSQLVEVRKHSTTATPDGGSHESKADTEGDKEKLKSLENQFQKLEKRVSKLERKSEVERDNAIKHMKVLTEPKPSQMPEKKSKKDISELDQSRLDKMFVDDEGKLTKDLMSAVFSRKEIATSSRTGHCSHKATKDGEIQKQEKLDEGKVQAIYAYVQKMFDAKDQRMKKKLNKLIGIAFSEKCREVRNNYTENETEEVRSEAGSSQSTQSQEMTSNEKELET